MYIFFTILIIDEKPEVWRCATAEYGTYCQFPFIHEGVRYHKCTNLHPDVTEEVHCASNIHKDGTAAQIKKCIPDSCVKGKYVMRERNTK